MTTSKLKLWALAGAATTVIAQAALAQETPVEQTPSPRTLYVPPGESEEPSVAVERVVVTGTNIGGLTPESTPLETYTAEDMRNLGVADIQTLMRYVPQNLSSVTSTAIGTGAATNDEALTAFDLRGLGAGSTLTLLNGRRLALSGSFDLAYDVSALPLAALERVEIMTDGASSIYGSDAVAGVVNFITRTDYEGAETSAQYEMTTDGGYQLGRLDQTLGAKWSTGNILGNLGYSTTSPLDCTDRDYVPDTVKPCTLSPVEQRYSAFVTGRQELSSHLAIFGDLLYSDRSVKSKRSLGATALIGDSSAEQIFANAGARYQLTRNLGAELNATYSDVDNSTIVTQFIGGAETNTPTNAATSLDVSAKVDGSLFTLWNGSDVLFVVGGGNLNEEFESGVVTVGGERSTNYGFAEVQVPLVSPSQDIPLVQYFDINVSGRYTEIEDIDESFDPKVGLVWSVSPDLKLRATYSESFRAPTLANLNGNLNQLIFVQAGDPNLPVVDPFDPVAGDSIFLIPFGPFSRSLEPETSTNYTGGFDLTPRFLPGVKASLTYWDIDYSNRILLTHPGFFTTLFDPSAAPELYNTNPTVEDITEVLATSVPAQFVPFPSFPAVDLTDPVALAGVVDVIIDGRSTNLASSRTNGIDLSLDYTTGTGAGQLSVGGVATYIFEIEQQGAPSSAPVDPLNTVGQPVDFRGRAYLGYASGSWNARANVNYVNSYEVSTTNTTEVDSWTTLDLLAGYTFDSIGGGLLVQANVRNVFDEDPPYVDPAAFTNFGPAGFDNANADPFGRVAGVKLIQTW